MRICNGDGNFVRTAYCRRSVITNFKNNLIGTSEIMIDLENKLTIVQIDSLSVLIEEINKKNDVYLYIVTIDSFYPDSTIVDFSNRYREFWAPQETPQKGIILMIFSTTQRQVRISTGDVSMTYLTDIECDDVIRGMTPYFKKGKYLEGLTNGLLAIEIRL